MTHLIPETPPELETAHVLERPDGLWPANCHCPVRDDDERLEAGFIGHLSGESR